MNKIYIGLLAIVLVAVAVYAYVPLAPGYTHAQIEQRQSSDGATHESYNFPNGDGATTQPAETTTEQTGEQTTTTEKTTATDTTQPATPMDYTWIWYALGVIIAIVVIWFLWKTFAK